MGRREQTTQSGCTARPCVRHDRLPPPRLRSLWPRLQHRVRRQERMVMRVGLCHTLKIQKKYKLLFKWNF
jgi:hypothetical protein